MLLYRHDDPKFYDTQVFETYDLWPEELGVPQQRAPRRGTPPELPPGWLLVCSCIVELKIDKRRRRLTGKAPFPGVLSDPTRVGKGWGHRKGTRRNPGISMRFLAVLKRFSDVLTFSLYLYTRNRWMRLIYGGRKYRASVPVTEGEHSLRWVLRWNTPGRADGFVKVLWDGKTVISAERLKWDTPKDRADTLAALVGLANWWPIRHPLMWITVRQIRYRTRIPG